MARRTEAERRSIPAEDEARALDKVAVESGDMISLVVGPKGTHFCDTTLIELVITEVGGRERVWNLTPEVVPTLLAGNPHADGQGHADVWHFYAEKTKATPQAIPSEPPLVLASQAASAREFIAELEGRKLSTIRQQTRAHEEQTWERRRHRNARHQPAASPGPAAGIRFRPWRCRSRRNGSPPNGTWVSGTCFDIAKSTRRMAGSGSMTIPMAFSEPKRI